MKEGDGLAGGILERTAVEGKEGGRRKWNGLERKRTEGTWR